MSRFFSYVKTHKLLALIVLVVLIGGIYFSQKKAVPTYETTTVKKGDVFQRVSVTGRVESESEATLSFERTGRVSSQPVPVGTRVKRGDVLVRLDAQETEALRMQAKANLDYELVHLAELKKGTRAEDISVSESQVQSAASTVVDARNAVDDKLNEAYTQSDDAIRNKTDVLFTNARTRDPRVVFTSSDDKLVAEIQATRAALESALATASDDRSLHADSDVAAVSARMESFLDQLKSYLDKLALAVNSVIPSSSVSQTTIDGWKVSVAAARTNVNTAVNGLTSADAAYRSARSALVVAENQLALKRAGATPEQLAAQESRIAAQRASVANYDAQIAKSMLIAPFSGVVTKQDAKFGQTVAPSAPIVALMSDSGFKITANVPEVDVAKLANGASASVTLDAYGPDVVFAASVAQIDPAETILEGVSTYKITLRFATHDERIRSGMTANIEIDSNKREGVLYLPARSVVTKDGKKFVKVPGPELSVVEKEVTTGLRGSNGMIEMVSGVTEGETVITLEK